MVAKTVSVGHLGHGMASRAVQQAQDEPVLVSKANRPAAWLISAEQLARVAAARGGDLDLYDRALELLALDLYQRGVLTVAQAASLVGLPLGDFIDLCGRLQVPILWEPDADLQTEAEAAAAIAAASESSKIL